MTHDRILRRLERLERLDRRAEAELDRRIADVEFLCRDSLYRDASDVEIAADVGVPVDVVRGVRRRLARDTLTADVTYAARELAEAMGFRGDPQRLIVPALQRVAKLIREKKRREQGR